MNCLIVDDDPALRGMLGFSLESEGYQVFEAASRAEAITCFSEYDIQVAILDMGMPPAEHTPEEGLAVLDWLCDHAPQVKTLVLTGQNPQATSYLALKHGGFDFLEKPIAQAQLMQAVKRARLFYEQEAKLKDQEGVHKVSIEVSLGEGVKAVRNSAEEKLVRQVLTQTHFNVHETARLLGLKRENVYYLIKKYSIEREALASSD